MKRVYVEKKPEYALKAKHLKEELKRHLGIEGIENVRILSRYDIENISEKTYKESLNTVFCEPPLDECYEMEFPYNDNEIYFSSEYLAGQFDQRADSAIQCLKLINENEDPDVRTAFTYVISGSISEDEVKKIKSYIINPVDSHETDEKSPKTLKQSLESPDDVETVYMTSAGDLKKIYDSLSPAMTFEDFKCIRDYFKSEKREPTITELKVLDTYWSDHCRHTTFLTNLDNISIDEGYYNKVFCDSYTKYLEGRKILKRENGVCLMDLALAAMRQLKLDGKLNDLEESDEINACSITVNVKIDGKDEEWLINFKNETHNHPTEIEPFGGAATCLGGAIRDPLAGRTYVYQAMRVSGVSDPETPLEDTIPGRLPQRKIAVEAAHGYSSYGNQIGLATGYVKEIYHEGYAAKHMEVGAVLGAARRADVVRKKPVPGDVVVLLGGKTGRDGIGGAAGSSKAHKKDSMETCGAQVQKGNPPEERKIQRLFRKSDVSRLIKKCNDFGAGGVCVAIGELAPGLIIDLDKVPKKYAGLDGTELAISESQERMAVVLDKADLDTFIAFAKDENLECVKVAEVSAEPRLVMLWRGKRIVDISRAFLDTNGAVQSASARLAMPDTEENPFKKNVYFSSLNPGMYIKKLKNCDDTCKTFESIILNNNEDDSKKLKALWFDMLNDLNVCSQKGLVEMFDSSVGAATVNMPFGGRFQLSEIQAMSAKLPLLRGDTDAVTIMSYGFDPYLSSWSPYHGGVYAVIDSIAKIVCAGGDRRKIHFTFQEYFKRMDDNPYSWGQPFLALLGAYTAQLGTGLASVGGKDSMSGSFNDMNVPPTLISFAVAMGDINTSLSPEFKKQGNKLVLIDIKKDGYDLPDYDDLCLKYDTFFEDVKKELIESAFALSRFGIAEAVTKMAFGNLLGVKLEHNVDSRQLFAPAWGNILAEVKPENVGRLSFNYTVIGEVDEKPRISWHSLDIRLDDALSTWYGRLAKVYKCEDIEPVTRKIAELSGNEANTVPLKSADDVRLYENDATLYKNKDIYICRHKKAQPKVFIPVMPGTNSEYDSERAFVKAGADVNSVVFRNLSTNDINDSIQAFKREIASAQIIMLPGGFSAGDEPDGSAKYFASVLRNAYIKEEIYKLLNERDGLILGICNGFQTLIKTGLLPYGNISAQNKDSATLAKNGIGRHIAKTAYTKVISCKSPWLAGAKPGEIYAVPASHGEGRFIASKEILDALFANGQVACVFTDCFGNASDEGYWNINSSYMGIEGITSPDGRIFGKMAHAERTYDGICRNTYGNKDMGIFKSGVEYFR